VGSEEEPGGTGGASTPGAKGGSGPARGTGGATSGTGGNTQGGMGGATGQGGASGAGRSDGGSPPSNTDGGAPPAAVPGMGSQNSRPHPTNVVFDDTKLPAWNLTIAAADLAKMNTALLDPDPSKKEVYVPATLKVDADDVGKVAVRYKGAFGTLQSCVQSGMNVCKKMSLKVDFAEFEPNKRFYGLKKINLHAQRADGTQLHEKLAYKMFRDMGIPAPRSVHGRVFINGDYKGLYGVTEVIDGRFLDYWFPKGQADGNLYKEAWPLSQDRNYYLRLQKTNEPDPKDPMRVVVPPNKVMAAAMAMSNASATELPKVVDSWMNTDYMMRYLAVDRATTNWDGAETFYCGGATSGCGNHNFYLYESQTENRLYVLPWDLDNTWQVFSWWEVVWPWNLQNPSCGMNTQVFTNWLGRPACDKIFKGLAASAGPTRFAAALGELLDKHFNVEAMRGLIDQWASHIAPAVMMDLNGPGFMPWMTNVANFKRDLALLREKMLAIKAGMEPRPLGLKVGGVSDFENQTPLNFTMGTSAGATARTTFMHALNTTGAIGGKSDIKLDFELQNPTDDAAGSAYYQRAYVRLTFDSPTANLQRLRQIKLRLKSDVNRPVRVELGSSAYKTTMGRIPRQGWEVMATAAGGVVTLDRAMMGIAPGFTSPGDDVNAVLGAVNQVYIMAQPAMRDAQGLMPMGAKEKGFLQIDDVEILLN
jgi:hypothetical protein